MCIRADFSASYWLYNQFVLPSSLDGVGVLGNLVRTSVITNLDKEIKHVFSFIIVLSLEKL